MSGILHLANPAHVLIYAKLQLPDAVVDRDKMQTALFFRGLRGAVAVFAVVLFLFRMAGRIVTHCAPVTTFVFLLLNPQSVSLR